MIIRTAVPADHHAIDGLLRQAFPSPQEADLVKQLFADGDAVIALVAEVGQIVVGAAIFSPMTASFPALSLAPVAVAADHRRKGIAARLIREGLRLARADEWEAVFVLGHPQYYERFGFTAQAAAGFENPYAGPYLMAVALRDGGLPASTGKVDYAKAFRDL